MNVLVFCDFYLPGYRAGGPIRSISSMVEALGDHISFRIITQDRDWGDKQSYEEVPHGRWTAVGKAEVLYISLADVNLRTIRRLIHETPHDLIYLNSFFSLFTRCVLVLRKLGRIPISPIVIAPRGELAPQALRLKALKKQLYRIVARRIGLYKGLYWQATSEHEKNDILLNSGVTIVWGGPSAQGDVAGPCGNVVSDFPARGIEALVSGVKSGKKAGHLKMVFLSRIARMKNIETAIRAVAHVSGQIAFDIYGPIEDPDYWGTCQRRIAELPSNISVQYCGPVKPQDVSQTLRLYDLFILPTRGENYGHAIIEALCAGCPVLISDRTPWRGLEAKGVGWDVPLEDINAFARVIQQCVGMTGNELAQMVSRAIEFGQKAISDDTAVTALRSMFEHAVGNFPRTLS